MKRSCLSIWRVFYVIWNIAEFDPFEKRERAFKKKYKYRIDELEEIAKKENIRIEFDSLSEGK